MLGERGLHAALLEKDHSIAPLWRRHYDSLHLRTDRGHSGLPGLPMPHSYPRYPSCMQILDDIEGYAAHFKLEPVFRCPVHEVCAEGARWKLRTAAGDASAPVVVIATGWADAPRIPTWPGMDRYHGEILHSTGYHNASPYRGKRVLVGGFGNSGGDIAGPRRRRRRDHAGGAGADTHSAAWPAWPAWPALTWAMEQTWLPPRLTDAFNAPLIRVAVGSTLHLGLTISRKGPRRMIA